MDKNIEDSYFVKSENILLIKNDSKFNGNPRGMIKLLNLNVLRRRKTFTKSKLINYLLKLHALIKRQQQQIRILQLNLKKVRIKLKKKNDQGITENTNDDQVQEHKNNQHVITNSEIIDCTKEIQAAAAEAADSLQIDNEFLYEPTSGLYYHRLTGYYYNAEHGLYYDGNTGCYYNYDQYKNEYVFHSQVETPEITDTKRKKGKKKPKNCILKTDKHKPAPAVTIVGKPSKNNVIEVNSSDSSNDCCEIKAQVIKKTKKLRDDTKMKKEQNAIDHVIKKEESNTDDCALEEGEVPSSDESEQLNDKDDNNNNNNDVNDDNDVDGGVVCVVEGDGGEDDVREIDDSSDDDEDDDNEDDSDTIIDSNVIDLTVNYPPALRIIVQDTKLSNLKIGTLFVITCVGGTLGREGTHDVLIPDENISKYHLKFAYDAKKQIYQCIDFGSRNGTLLNGVRMSSAKQESGPLELAHGSVIELSQTKLLCHIHNGANTCVKCEPGLTMIEPKTKESGNDTIPPIEVCSHKQQLKNIRKKYGLQEDKYIIQKLDKKIKNSAEERRKLVGSSHTSEKTDYASVDKAISQNNIGFKMMSKLGWKEGEKIGKNDSGLLDPIVPQLNQHKQGFGYPSNVASSSSNRLNYDSTKTLSKKEILNEKMKNRYQQKFIQSSTGLNQESIVDEYDEVFKKIDIDSSNSIKRNKKIIINVKKSSPSPTVVINTIDITKEDITHNNNNNNNINDDHDDPDDRNDDK